MATLNDVMELVKAGFTAEQIRGMVAAEQTQQPAPTATPEKAPAPDPMGIEARLDKITATLESVGNMVVANNILNSQQPPVETVDDILAKILDPREVDNNGSK